MFEVILQAAGCANILHQEGAGYSQCPVDAIEYTLGYRLIMYRVECSNEIKPLGFSGMLEVAQVADFELNITQPGNDCLLPGLSQRLRGQVVACEAGFRVAGRQLKQDPSLAAANIQNANTRF